MTWIDSPPIQSESKNASVTKTEHQNCCAAAGRESKACAQPILKVKQKEPSAIIKQRMQSLAAQSSSIATRVPAAAVVSALQTVELTAGVPVGPK
ncbi:hypothetical protein DPMN_094067 [Dreissena polymorpha]|uniref:Uncharacterized protein n=1 Tax=Dreissena polymorpha TaxID=45954 RepID=A0A9D4L440_DREPO|nr:hypothetical protein DPMN_094067 [Dreissena polymorpha]